MSSPAWHRRRAAVRARAAARRSRRVQVLLARFPAVGSADALRGYEAAFVERVEHLRDAAGATLVELLTRLGADRVEWSEPATGATVFRYELSLTLPREPQP